MTSTTPRIITIALAMLAIAVPAASAMPMYEHGDTATTEPVHRRHPHVEPRRHDVGAGAGPAQPRPAAPQPAEPTQDLRNPDNRAPGVEAAPAPTDTSRIPVQQSPYTPAQLKPISTPQAAPVADDGPSPFVYIIPSVVLIALLGAGIRVHEDHLAARPPVGCLTDSDR